MNEEIKKCLHFLQSLETHITDTQTDKYSGEGDVQVVDLLYSHQLLEDFCVGNIIKYVIRRKNNFDLLKAAHYVGILYEINDLKTDPGVESNV